MKFSTLSVPAFAAVSLGHVVGRSSGWAGERFAALEQRAPQCGPGIGSCGKGECCSDSGNCGTGEDFCQGSQCQLDYSDACDTFFGPPGKTTENVARTKLGKVPYGTVITECETAGTMALTFDDGPYIYTTQILDLLEKRNVKATFFITGNNRGKGHLDDESLDWPNIVRRMHSSGHQLASHTWTHRDLNQVNKTIQWTEMVYNEMAFRNILGFFPTYMRPPFLECSDESGCTDMMETLGYHIIDMNIDTKDYENDDAALIQISKDRFSKGLSTSPSNHDYITLAHDVHYQTVVNLTSYMIDLSLSRGYKLVTVGECLGDPKENWYRQASGGPVTPPVTSTTPPTTATTTKTTTTSYPTPTKAYTISPDQSCGGTKGYTCQGSKFGNCCSNYGFCGSSSSYCGTGCDPNFGTCTPVSGGISDTTNGLCGTKFMATCSNYGAKTCCSQYGFCGNTAQHCGTGCQSKYGKCT